MKLTFNNQVVIPDNSESFFATDQAADAALLIGTGLAVLENRGVELQADEFAILINQINEYRQDPATGLEALAAALRLTQAVVKSDKMDELLQKLLDALGDDGRVDLLEGIGAGIHLPGAVKDEIAAQKEA